MGIINIRYGMKNLIMGKNYKLIADVVMIDDGTMRYQYRPQISEAPESVLINNGYKIAYKFNDKLEYAGLPVYLRIKNFKEYQLTDKDPRDTASTLHDFWRSNTIEKYKKGLSKIAKVGQVDIKMIGIIVIVIAIAAGFIFLFGGGF